MEYLLANAIIPMDNPVYYDKPHRSNSQGNCVEMAVVTRDPDAGEIEQPMEWRDKHIDVANIAPLSVRTNLGRLSLAA